MFSHLVSVVSFCLVFLVLYSLLFEHIFLCFIIVVLKGFDMFGNALF